LSGKKRTEAEKSKVLVGDIVSLQRGALQIATVKKGLGQHTTVDNQAAGGKNRRSEIWFGEGSEYVTVW